MYLLFCVPLTRDVKDYGFVLLLAGHTNTVVAFVRFANYGVPSKKPNIQNDYEIHQFNGLMSRISITSSSNEAIVKVI
jgi:hypothetical protein